MSDVKELGPSDEHGDPENADAIKNMTDEADAVNGKYNPTLTNRPTAVSSFLQKRLQKGQKFFDSGDYNVAKSIKKTPPGVGVPPHLPHAALNAQTKRNMALLLPPSSQENSDQHMPVLTPEDLPHHTHPHEPSKLVNHVNPATN